MGIRSFFAKPLAARVVKKYRLSQQQAFERQDFWLKQMVDFLFQRLGTYNLPRENIKDIVLLSLYASNASLFYRIRTHRRNDSQFFFFYLVCIS